jgi:hypothetical protein
MWRWIIRAWVSLVLFWMLMLSSCVALIAAVRQMARLGIPFLLQQIHSHALLSMFLLGMLAGQVVLGSNFTGRGWFRSKSGLTYEGFKLENIKPWTWLMISPVLLLGVVLWAHAQSESIILSNISVGDFYHDVITPNCSLSWWKNYRLYPCCGVQLLCVGVWMASLGYSIAPKVRRQGTRLIRSLKSAPDTAFRLEAGGDSSMKKKAKLQ